MHQTFSCYHLRCAWRVVIVAAQRSRAAPLKWAEGSKVKWSNSCQGCPRSREKGDISAWLTKIPNSILCTKGHLWFASFCVGKSTEVNADDCSLLGWWKVAMENGDATVVQPPVNRGRLWSSTTQWLAPAVGFAVVLWGVFVHPHIVLKLDWSPCCQRWMMHARCRAAKHS